MKKVGMDKTGTIIFYSVVDPREPGGVETILRGIMNRLSGMGVQTVGLRSDQCALYVRDDSERRVHLPSLARAMRHLLIYRPRVVNVHFLTSEVLYFALLKPWFGYRLVISTHGSDIFLPDPKSKALMSEMLCHADAITVVSEEMQQRVAQIQGVDLKRLHLVPNGIDSQFWCPPARSRSPGMRMVAAGRLEHVKGFDLLIAAFADVAKTHKDARLIIAGQGSLEQALKQQALDTGHGDRIRFVGFLDREALRKTYREADFFVLPSRSEGFPIALLEAMATGLPFVAAEVGGVSEIATSESGICAKPHDIQHFAAALEKALAGQLGAEAGKAARRRAESFSIDRSEEAYVELILPGTARQHLPGALPEMEQSL